MHSIGFTQTGYSIGVPPLVITPDSVTTNTLVPVTFAVTGVAVQVYWFAFAIARANVYPCLVPVPIVASI